MHSEESERRASSPPTRTHDLILRWARSLIRASLLRTKRAPLLKKGPAQRSYGTGRLYVHVDGGGRGHWYGTWWAGGVGVKRKIGFKRRPGTSDGLTRTQAEAELRRRIATDVVVAAGARRTVFPAGRRCGKARRCLAQRVLPTHRRALARDLAGEHVTDAINAAIAGDVEDHAFTDAAAAQLAERPPP